jgi:hypothetical protein
MKGKAEAVVRRRAQSQSAHARRTRGEGFLTPPPSSRRHRRRPFRAGSACVTASEDLVERSRVGSGRPWRTRRASGPAFHHDFPSLRRERGYTAGQAKLASRTWAKGNYYVAFLIMTLEPKPFFVPPSDDPGTLHLACLHNPPPPDPAAAAAPHWLVVFCAHEHCLINWLRRSSVFGDLFALALCRSVRVRNAWRARRRRW